MGRFLQSYFEDDRRCVGLNVRKTVCMYDIFWNEVSIRAEHPNTLPDPPIIRAQNWTFISDHHGRSATERIRLNRVRISRLKLVQGFP